MKPIPNYTAEQIRQHFGMGLHPEGGWFTMTHQGEDTFRAAGLPQRYEGDRNASTAIYYLLTPDTYSAFHRLQTEELWHHYTGGTVVIHVIFPDGRYKKIKCGPRLQDGEQFQVLVPKQTWFSAEVEAGDDFGLVGCTTAPGFSYKDFELGKEAELIAAYPQHRHLFERLCREEPVVKLGDY